MDAHARRNLIESLLRERGYGYDGGVVAVDRGAPLRASLAQERMWFWDRATSPRSFLHNVPLTARLRGPIDVECLGQAFQAIIDRHELLRSSFRFIGAELYQYSNETLAAPMTLIDFSNENDPWASYELFGLADARHCFELTQVPLIKASLARIAADDHVLLVTAHHILWDGWSTGMLVYELAAHYKDLQAGASLSLTTLPVQYADWSAWQHRVLRGERLEKLQAYWRNELADAETVHVRPTKVTPPSGPSDKGKTISFSVSDTLTLSLQEFGKQEDATLFMVLMAALTALIHGRSGESDLTVGGLISNRTTKGIEGLIGYFVNTVVIRSRASGADTFRDHLRRIRRVTLRSYEHQALPIGRVSRLAAPARKRGFDDPLYSVDFVFQSAERPETDFGDVALSVPDRNTRTADYDMGLVMWQRLPDLKKTAGLEGWWEYKTDLFGDAAAQALIDQFVAILSTVADEPDTRLSDLPPVSSEDRTKFSVLGSAEFDSAPLSPSCPRPANGDPDERVWRDADGEIWSFPLIKAALAPTAASPDQPWLRLWRGLLDGDAVAVSVPAERFGAPETTARFTADAVTAGCAALIDHFGLGPKDHVLQLGQGHDMESLCVAMTRLSIGARVTQSPHDAVNASTIRDWVFKDGANVIHSGPEFLRLLLNEFEVNPGLTHQLRAVFVSAGPITERLARTWRATLPGVALWRAFWPPVAAGPCAWHELDTDVFYDSRWDRIGSPAPGHQLLILDGAGAPSLPGAVGDLFVAGPSLACAVEASKLGLPKPPSYQLRSNPFATGPAGFMATSGLRARADLEGRAECRMDTPELVHHASGPVAAEQINEALRIEPYVESARTEFSLGEDCIWSSISYVELTEASPAKAQMALQSLWRSAIASDWTDFAETNPEVLDWVISQIHEDECILVVCAATDAPLAIRVTSFAKQTTVFSLDQIEAIGALPAEHFGAVIVDTVVACLPGCEHLMTFIDRLLGLGRADGRLILCGLRNDDLISASAASSFLACAAPDTPASHAHHFVENARRLGVELSVSPQGFEDFCLSLPGVDAVLVQPRVCLEDTAAATLLFDGVVYKRTSADRQAAQNRVSWQLHLGEEQLDELIPSGNLQDIVIEAFADRRVLDARACERATDEILPGATIDILKKAAAQPDHLLDFDRLRDVMQARGFHFVQARFSQTPDTFDVAFSKSPAKTVPFSRRSQPVEVRSTDWTSSPASKVERLQTVIALRVALADGDPPGVEPDLICVIHDASPLPSYGLNLATFPARPRPSGQLTSPVSRASRLAQKICADLSGVLYGGHDREIILGLLAQPALRTLLIDALEATGHGPLTKTDVDSTAILLDLLDQWPGNLSEKIDAK
ncbi:condensation domain-containing protein [Roseovarius sp. M141]|uniref:condensation domain-containing protein n=1 Tax=Roseovarius sp. M141 TaxID=2583806 RepID=UPI0020CC8755|nr:condensation domain-containing protein [Roseovarius sp. M141]MCQ0090772.1 hypothetical protein [Roseovarius sp. M141]